MEVSSCELYIFIRNIYDYEEGIYDIIKDFFRYKFKNKEELEKAVEIWCNWENTGMILYNHISFWDTSMITDMSDLFYDEVIRFVSKNISGMKINATNLLDLRSVKKTHSEP